MIEAIRFLRNIGKFDSYSADADLLLLPLSLIYAENGRGKTTLAGVFRSLATGDPIPILGRHRLGAQNSPHVVVRCAGEPAFDAIFQDGAWTHTLPNMGVFDDAFVDQNVYSGLAVSSDHRQNLHELILGAQGVGLNQQLQREIEQIEADNREIRQCAEAIPVDGRHGLSVDDYCALPQNPNIENDLLAAERRLAASQAQAAVQRTAVFAPFPLPEIDLESIRALLNMQQSDLDAEAAARVQEHLSMLGEGAEAWVEDGMRRQQPTGGEEVANCVFCDQDLSGSPVIEHYRAFFGKSYRQLKDNVANMNIEFQQSHSGDVLASFQRAIGVVNQRHQFWAQFCEVPVASIDIDSVANDWRAARELMAAHLAAKQAAPLEQIAITPETVAAVQAYSGHRTALAQISDSLQQTNQVIEQVKQDAANQDAAEIAGVCDQLRATQARFSDDMPVLCQSYLDAKAAKIATEARRRNARNALEQYREKIFPVYEDRINHYLSRFNVGYRIDSVVAVNTRGGPTCTYCVVINHVQIRVAGGETVPGTQSFRNTLSSGDRAALALAFFFASIDLDPNRGEKIIVIDDPVSSFDDHRSLTTVQEIRRLAAEVKQVIVLSHNRLFLCRIWEGATPTIRAALHVHRVGNDSAIQSWNVDQDCISEHDRRHESLSIFLTHGGQNQREIAISIRPHLEAFLRVAYAGGCPPGTMLGSFLADCDQRLGTAEELLSQGDIEELRELKDYANRFHHDPNPAHESEAINDQELVDFVRRTLSFVRRP